MFFIGGKNSARSNGIGLSRFTFIILQYVSIILFFQLAAALVFDASIKYLNITKASDLTDGAGKLFALFSGMLASSALTYSLIQKYFSTRPGKESLSRIGIAKCSASAALIGVLLGISLAIIFEKYLPALYPSAETHIAASVRLLGDSSATLMPFYLLGSVGIGPIVEEFFFRGFLYQVFSESYGKVISALAVSIVFVLLHFQAFEYWVALMSLVFGSIALVILREKSGSLIPPVLMHQFYNLGVAMWGA